MGIEIDFEFDFESMIVDFETDADAEGNADDAIPLLPVPPVPLSVTPNITFGAIGGVIGGGGDIGGGGGRDVRL